MIDTLAVVFPWRDEWHVKDHLGNVRVVVDLNASWDSSLIVEQNDYLPFGTRFTPATQGVIDSANQDWYGFDLDNRYRYAGKEEQRFGNQIDLGLLDFGARSYDPFTARWTSVDPLAHKYSSLSPYNYCGGNPIMFLDPDGMEIGDYYKYDGTFYATDFINDNKIYLIDTDFIDQLKDSKELHNLSKYSEEVDGLIIINRISNSSSETRGSFHTVGSNGVSGFTMERGGTPSTESNKNLPIPEGVYDTMPRKEGNIGNHFAFRLYNSDVPVGRGILGHIGNTPDNSRGCVLFGLGKEENRISYSGKAMDALKQFYQDKTSVKLIINKCY